MKSRRKGPAAVMRVLSNRLALVGGAIIALFLLTGLLAPWLAPHDPLTQDLGSRLQPGCWRGNWAHPLGTDELGRDLLSRVLFGARVSMAVGAVAVLLMTLAGSALGVVSAYYGGAVDAGVSRVIDILMSFPYIMLAIGIMAALGQGVVNAMLAIGITMTPSMARLVRSVALNLKDAEFVVAARALAASDSLIIRRHILPNVLPHVIIYAALSMGETVLYIAALGFLGLGVQPPTPEWGAMIATGKNVLILGHWWVSLFPGLAIAVAVLGFVLLGDGLRDLVDPRLVGAR